MSASFETNLKAFNSNFSICSQITPSDMANIAARGFKSIVCNRPDHESEHQPTFAQIAAAASLFGLKAEYLPANSVSAIDNNHAELFVNLIRDLPTPTLAYCRTGLRSARFWELAVAHDTQTSTPAT